MPDRRYSTRCGHWQFSIAAIPGLHINATQTPRRRMATSESKMLSPTALRERYLSGCCVPCRLYGWYCAFQRSLEGSHGIQLPRKTARYTSPAVPIGSHACL